MLPLSGRYTRLLLQYSGYDIFFFTLEKSGSDLYKALTDTRILNVDGRVVLYGILNEHYPTVLKSFIHKNITNFQTIEMMLYYLPKDKALDFTVVYDLSFESRLWN